MNQSTGQNQDRGDGGSSRSRLLPPSLPGPQLCQILKHNEFCFITVLNELEGGKGVATIKILIKKKIPTGRYFFFQILRCNENARSRGPQQNPKDRASSMHVRSAYDILARLLDAQEAALDTLLFLEKANRL